MKNFKSGLMVLLAIGSSLMASTQVPNYSSLPTASGTLFLDFDGHYVDATAWNITGPFACAPSGLSNTQITEVYNRVAEDYRPFKINVTTDSAKFLAAPADKRMRLIITVSHSWYGNGAGGVAMPSSFTWGDDTPAFVFSQLLSFNVKYIAEAAAHEAGHTLGLQHQSIHNAGCTPNADGTTLVSTYNYGSGPTLAEGSEIGWAPIMGVGYYRNMSVWHTGTTPWDCSNPQDDLSIITSTLSPSNPAEGYRTDDHTTVFNTSTWANFSNNQFTVNGIIETSADQDMFRFTLPSSGRFQLNAIPYNVGSSNAGSDVDLSIQLLNAAQVVINTYNPGTLLSSIIDSVMDAGTYYLLVDGKGNQFAPEYGSLGSYSLQGNYTAGNPLPLRVLRLNGTTANDKHNLSWIIDADEAITSLSVEVSADGSNFSPLVTTANEARSFSYKPFISNAAQYRLNVSFDNGRQYYSNVVTIRGAGAPRPKLISNQVTGSTIMVSSPGNYEYALSDLSGKLLQKGRVVNGVNTLQAGGLINGLYLIRFTDGTQQWNEKIMRR
jgi:hypothetical protein